jgi:hypothetical protein
VLTLLQSDFCPSSIRSLSWLGIVVVLSLVGCGSNGRSTVEGTVTLNGQPIESGSMSFRPLDGKTPTVGCFITAGRFRLQVPIGSMRVEITAMEKSGKGVTTAQGAPVEVDLVTEAIPERYNAKSELVIDVKPGVNRVTYALDR